MASISTNINFTALKAVSVRSFKSKSGELVDCLVIPIEHNNLIRGEKGVYLSATGFEIKKKIEGGKDTHVMKQSLPKAIYEAMSEEEKRAMPIIGSNVLWAERSGELGQAEVVVQDAEDGLPF